MSATEREKQIYGPGVEIIRREKGCTVYRLADETGEAVMTSYQVFPGVDVIYNDVHRPVCGTDVLPLDGLLEIDHCREGRMECEVCGEYIYMTPGDLTIHRKVGNVHNTYFPLSHYHGITVALDTDSASRCLSCILEDTPVKSSELMERYCQNHACTVIRARPGIEHIFSELYSIPEQIREGYLKIKVMELLLFLGGTDLAADAVSDSRYFPAAQVEAVKAAKEYLTQHTEKHITVSELAERFGISQTTLKACFRGVFGESVYTFARQFKMQKAAVLLRQTNKNVMEIAGIFGYDNGSKFAKAFRDVMGETPDKYRRASRADWAPEKNREKCPNGAEANQKDWYHLNI